MKTQLAVLGGGPGGYTAAFIAADMGLDVVVIDERGSLGGVCLMEGCIPSKALLHASGGVRYASELAEWGVVFPPYSIDLAAMRARKAKTVDALKAGLARLAGQRRVRVVKAHGVLESSTEMRLKNADGPDDDRLEFDRLIFACGSAPAIPAAWRISGAVMDSRAALELPDIPETLLVAGGGYIGLEIGTIYARLGSRVTVVEMLDGLLPGLDRDLVRPVERSAGKLFAEVLIGTKIAGVSPADGGVEVHLETPEGKRTERFSRMLAATGRRPNTAGLGLENTTARLDERGFIVVDGSQRTADERILAVGDTAGEPMLAHKAAHQGRIAAEVAAGGSAPGGAGDIPAVVFTDPPVARVGLTERQARERGLAVETARFPWSASGLAHAWGRTDGLTKLLLEAATGRILGAGIVGPEAGELISEAALAIKMGCTAADIASTVHPHPTFSETLHGAAAAYLGVSAELPRRR